MAIEERDKKLARIEEKLNELPWYVGEFIRRRQRKSSPNTLLTYCFDYQHFFNWLVSEAHFSGKPSEVPLTVLETLRVQDIDNFEDFCAIKLHNANDTIARKLASLKSLFHYLSQIAEDENLYPYLKRNVMARVEIEKEKVTFEEKAERIQDKILRDNEFDEFREFVALGYGKYLEESKQKRKLSSYLRSRERDLALISLILGSGLRVSEALSINLDDFDWNQNHVFVVRKGNKKDRVTFSEVARRDLREYEEVRKVRYKISDADKINAFFVSSPTGKGGITSRLTIRAAQKMIDKYADAFGKPTLSVHKLRHSFATRHYQENNNLAQLQTQLGHSSVNTSMIYTHITSDALKDAVNKADN